METKRSEFDLAKARQGHPLITRSGELARLLCDDYQSPFELMLVVAVKKEGFEALMTTYRNGKSYYDGRECPDDLFLDTRNCQETYKVCFCNESDSKTYTTKDEAFDAAMESGQWCKITKDWRMVYDDYDELDLVEEELLAERGLL